MQSSIIVDQKKLLQNIETKLKTSNLGKEGDDLKKLLMECASFTDGFLGFQATKRVLETLQKQNAQPFLFDQDQMQIIKSCKSLPVLGLLHYQEQIKFFQKEKEFRENIRNQIDDASIQNDIHKAFFIEDIMKCKSKEEYAELSQIIKIIVNVLIDHGSDSFHFTKIFDVVLTALLLTGNNRTIGRDHFLLDILDKLQKLLDEQKSAYMWTIVLESIVNASTHKEGPQDLVQPNLIARIILAKIPYMDDLFDYLGKYLMKCYKFEYKMFESMLLYGVSQQALELILRFSKHFEAEFQMEILEQLRVGLVPQLAKFVGNVECFDQILNLLIYYLLGPTQQLEKQQLDYNSIQEIFKGYEKYYDNYNEKQLQRIANFIVMLKTINYDGGKITRVVQPVEQKIQKKRNVLFTRIETAAKNEKFDYWMGENTVEKQKEQTIVGLRNLLNTCYLNSFIQALYWTKDFRDLILQDFKKEEVVFLKPISLKTNFLRCFQYLDSMTEEIDFTPLLLKRSLREPYRSDIRQQDAGEFGAHLFEDMEKCFEKEEYSKVKELFYGISKSTFSCKNCQRKMQGPDEEFMQITLNFDDTKRNKGQEDDIEQMLDKHQSKEMLQYTCEACKMASQSYRSLEFLKLSQIVIFQINRFQFKGGIRSKINDKVKIQTQLKIKEKKGLINYELYATIIHFGPIPDAGHYTAYCKVQDCWYRFDDSFVTKIDKDFQKAQKNFQPGETPYLLFYRRMDNQK